MKKLTLFDILISVSLIVLIAGFASLDFIHNNGAAKKLLVETPHGSYYYDMNQEKTFDVTGQNGITRIQISGSKFRFVDSDCPNKDCVKMGWVGIGNYPIVCLPNKVSAYIVNYGDDTNEADEVLR